MRRAAGGRIRAWAELLRLPAVFTVPGDALAGGAAAGRRPDRRTALVIGASVCLYEAGMALNDWADREVDAVERPRRPLPSGRIRPAAALAAAGGLTAAGLALAAAAGRRSLAVSAALAATVWAYDLRLKNTPAGPVAMGAARALDLLLGAAADAQPGRGRRTAASALLLGAHTCAVTTLSRHEVYGGGTTAPLAALGTTAVVATAVAGGTPSVPAKTAALAYGAGAGRRYLHAALNPSPQLTQQAVSGGIRAMIPLQAALAARCGAAPTAASLGALVPLARFTAARVSPT